MNIVFAAQFTDSAVGATGLTVTVDIRSINRSSGVVATVQTGASATEWWKGLYYYRLTSADLNVYDYYAVFITAGTADLKEVPGVWARFSEAITTDASGYATATLAAGAITDASFTVPTLTGPASGVVGYMVQLWRSVFKLHVYNKTNNTIKTYADDGTTVVTTQTATSSTTSDSVGAAT